MTDSKRLFLLRHAKSSWDDPQLADHDRPLAPRGRRAAKRMAAHLREADIQPALVLCSSARRARETLELLALTGETIIERDLYGGSSTSLLERLHRVPEAVDSVMLIGHCPGIQDLAVEIVRGSAEIARLESSFPTGALACLTFAEHWPELRPGSARLTAFVKPRELG